MAMGNIEAEKQPGPRVKHRSLEVWVSVRVWMRCGNGEVEGGQGGIAGVLYSIQ